MVAQNIFFGIIAAAMVLSAIRVVTTKNVVHAALYLVLVLAGVAAQFILVGAEFTGVTQVLGLKSDSTPARIDGAVLDADIRQHLASGAAPLQAQARALSKQGVALYTGDFSGVFNKVSG